MTGIDVSHFQGAVDWPQTGVAFAYAKASEGPSESDPLFINNWQGIKNTNILRGAYHFFHPSLDAKAQADHFLQRLFAANGATILAPGDLPAMLDLEYNSDGPTEPEAYCAAIQTWLDAVEAATGRVPIIYTSASFWDAATASSTAFSRYPLWVAEYDVQTPKLPSGWASYAIWQNSGTGTCPGVTGNVDTDTFNGTLEELQALAGVTA